MLDLWFGDAFVVEDVGCVLAPGLGPRWLAGPSVFVVVGLCCKCCVWLVNVVDDCGVLCGVVVVICEWFVVV